MGTGLISGHREMGTGLILAPQPGWASGLRSHSRPSMPRRGRGATGGFIYHVLNRAVRRATLFECPADYGGFEQVLLQAVQRIPIKVLSYCVMPNHWHLIVWPETNMELPRFMHWLTGTHARRWHTARGTTGSGAVYQGRYKAIPIQSDNHVLKACRYVERNPLRGGLVSRAEEWRWSSTWRRSNCCDDPLLHPWPIQIPTNWIQFLNEPQTPGELESLRAAVRRSAPLGDHAWRAETARVLSLEAQLRPPGRPPKNSLIS